MCQQHLSTQAKEDQEIQINKVPPGSALGPGSELHPGCVHMWPWPMLMEMPRITVFSDIRAERFSPQR